MCTNSNKIILFSCKLALVEQTRSRNLNTENSKDISDNLKIHILEYELTPNKLKCLVYT